MAENYDFLRTFTVNGRETKHLFQIAKLNIPFLSKENEFYKVGNTDAKHFNNTRLGDYQISIDGFLIRDNSKMTISDTKDELVKIINSDEPVDLVFDVLPDRYFKGIFSGTQEYDATDLEYTPLTLVFDVPDGLAHQIEAQGFTNVEGTSVNMMLDSEFLKPDKYYKPWIQVLDEKNKGSNIMRADFTTGKPFDYGGNIISIREAWYMLNAMTRRMGLNLQKGKSVTFMGDVRVNVIDSKETYAGAIILEEWAENPIRIIKRHPIYIPNQVTSTFTTYRETIQISSDECVGLNLQMGMYGDFPSMDYSRPMFQIEAPTPMEYVASSSTVKEFLTYKNDGTYKTYPHFTFKMNGENGIVGLVHENGSVLQFGNPEDIDGVNKTKQEVAKIWNFWGNTLSPDFVVNSGFAMTYPYYLGNMDTPNLIQGSWNMTANADAAQPNPPGLNTGVWTGPSLVAPFPAASDNTRDGSFSANIRFDFDMFGTNNKISQNMMGRMEFVVMDVDGNQFMTAVFRDSYWNASDIFYFEMWYKGVKVNEVKVDKNKFKVHWREISMERDSTGVTWRLCSIKALTNNGQDNVILGNEFKFKFNTEEPDTTPLGKFGVWGSQFSNNPLLPMSITDAKMKWRNTQYFTDIKNFYKDGDLVEIDVKSRTLFINGVPEGRLNIVGNQWEQFVAEVGETNVKPIYSEWANPPEVTCTFEERYL